MVRIRVIIFCQKNDFSLNHLNYVGGIDLTESNSEVFFTNDSILDIWNPKTSKNGTNKFPVIEWFIFGMVPMIKKPTTVHRHPRR